MDNNTIDCYYDDLEVLEAIKVDYQVLVGSRTYSIEIIFISALLYRFSIQIHPYNLIKNMIERLQKSETPCKHYVEHIVIVIMRNKSRKLNFNSKINIKINRNLPTHQIHKLFSPNNHLLLSVKQFRLNSEKTCLLSVQSNYTPIVSLFFFFFL